MNTIPALPRDPAPVELAFRLQELGFLPEFPTGTEPLLNNIEDAIAEYQQFHGLEVDGIPGPETIRSMRAQRVCPYPDIMKMEGDLLEYKWPIKELRYGFNNLNAWTAQLPTKTVIEAFQLAWDYWSRVCDIHATYTPNLNEAHVRIEFGVIDKSGGTLAWSQLANNTTRPKQQKYDSRDNWILAANPTTRIDLVRVAAHEIGHVIGIGHISAGNLLAPTYNPRVRTPQAGDIKEAVARYGPPRNTDPIPDPGDKFVIEIQGTGNVQGLSATGWRATQLFQHGGE